MQVKRGKDYWKRQKERARQEREKIRKEVRRLMQGKPARKRRVGLKEHPKARNLIKYRMEKEDATERLSEGGTTSGAAKRTE